MYSTHYIRITYVYVCTYIIVKKSYTSKKNSKSKYVGYHRRLVSPIQIAYGVGNALAMWGYVKALFLPNLHM